MKNKKLLAWLAMFGTSLLCIVIYIFMTVEIVTKEGGGWELDPGADSIGMLVGASLLVAFFLLVFTVFFHGLIGFLGKHKIEEINFQVLRAIRKNKKNRWVACLGHLSGHSYGTVSLGGNHGKICLGSDSGACGSGIYLFLYGMVCELRENVEKCPVLLKSMIE